MGSEEVLDPESVLGNVHSKTPLLEDASGALGFK